MTFFHALKLNLRGVCVEQFFNTVYEQLEIKDYHGYQKMCAGVDSKPLDQIFRVEYC